MSSTIGNVIKYSLFGESHGPAIGMTISGLPAGLEIDETAIDSALDKRRTGGRLTSARCEADRVEWLSGLYNNITTGAPLTFIIKNGDQRPSDYDALRDIVRPSHADYSAYVKYGGHNDKRGGGMFSGRLTACYVVAGTIVRQLLKTLNIEIRADIVQLGELKIPQDAIIDRTVAWLEGLSDDYKRQVSNLLELAVSIEDSLGGRLRAVVEGLPAGVGEPHFNNVESVLAQYLYAVPGLKSLGFGDAEQFAFKRGSEV
ncbi:MAG: chorismate synthase, partial [Clostridiales bacterium]